MALGNANTSAQARGKAKPVIVKRRKEVMLAKGYNSFQIHESSFASVQLACSSTASCNLTVYHDGPLTTPARQHKVYVRPRANDKYRIEDGIYKASVSGEARYWMQIYGGQPKFGQCE